MVLRFEELFQIAAPADLGPDPETAVTTITSHDSLELVKRKQVPFPIATTIDAATHDPSNTTSTIGIGKTYPKNE